MNNSVKSNYEYLLDDFSCLFDNFDQMKKSNLATAEIFGPVLYLCPYNKIEEAVEGRSGCDIKCQQWQVYGFECAE